MRRMATLLIATCLVLSCSNPNQRPANALTVAQMEPVFWDLIQANLYAREYLRSDTSLDIRAYMAGAEQHIFEKHKVNSKDFFDTYAYYLRTPEEFNRMLDTMMVRHKEVPEEIKHGRRATRLNQKIVSDE
jgi:hypothetical protein